MATAEQGFQELQDKVNYFESTFQFFLTNQAFFSSVKDNLGSVIDQLQTDVLKLQEVTNMIPAQVEQELGNQEANLITRVVYEVRKTLKPNFDKDLNTFQIDLTGLEDSTESKIKEAFTLINDFHQDTTKVMATKSDIEGLELKIATIEPGTPTSGPIVDTNHGKMPPPAEFSGKPYPSDTKKILFVITHLGDTSAYKYIQNFANHFEKPDEE
ncbi:hypothetical protein BG006_003441 [Podila minutissima]|uniref:Uncharacterized protein n=1 Tax=Podila minutissima TaxID=64525 RepID=A0A9P5VGE3_9FUNG|nr:hypothetical protein BG006_003441 [Podila minutissima]